MAFYEYDLALPPADGIPLTVATLPRALVLLSFAIAEPTLKDGGRNGELHVLRVDATAEQWARAGAALRLTRSSFGVTVPVNRRPWF